MNFWTQAGLAILQRSGVQIPPKIMAKFQPELGMSFGQTLGNVSGMQAMMPMPPAMPTNINDPNAIAQYNQALQTYNTQMQAYRNQMIQQQMVAMQQSILQRQQNYNPTPSASSLSTVAGSSFPSYLS